ncbi:MAG: TetR/AcrR family transcriptional regulator [Polyangiales bacterium]|nr:TetR/AcrR family transcriptional regulator [Myxococcales bacterium]MCB9661490.1 TetR/AcrR family transcriptional regulator [Sandaracinaceae bacterium]
MSSIRPTCKLPSRREREREARREAIVAAAQEFVVETGYWEMSMDAVARRAELSKGALYLYFQNKDALCAEIAVRSMRDFIPFLRAASDAESVGLAKMGSMLNAYAEWFVRHPHMFRFAISWSVPGQNLDPNSESFAEYRRSVGEITKLGLDATRLGQQDGSIRADLDPFLLNLQLWTSLLGVFMAHLGADEFSKRLPFPIDMDAIVPFHIQQSLRAIAGPKAGPIG